METHNLLAVAINIAADGHLEQVDKSGKPYILHPLHLMNQLLHDQELAIIAVLHDTVEDVDWCTLDYLGSKGFSSRVLSALDLLTHRKEDTYQEYIDKICTNLDAITVKRKDLEHNSDITRLKGISQKDLKRMEKYHKAFIQLGKARDNLKGEL